MSQQPVSCLAWLTKILNWCHFKDYRAANKSTARNLVTIHSVHKKDPHITPPRCLCSVCLCNILHYIKDNININICLSLQVRKNGSFTISAIAVMLALRLKAHENTIAMQTRFITLRDWLICIAFQRCCLQSEYGEQILTRQRCHGSGKPKNAKKLHCILTEWDTC